MPLADKYIIDTFSKVPAVEQIYSERDADYYQITTIIDAENEDAYKDIYAQESELIREFGCLKFDFRVVARRGRPLHEVAGASIPIWHRSNNSHLCQHFRSM